MKNKWNGWAAKGEKSPRCKLTDVMVCQLRNRKAEGATLRELAGEFSISKTHAGAIARGEQRPPKQKAEL